MGQKVADRVNSTLFQIVVSTRAEEQARDGLRGKAPHRVRRDSSSRPPVQHPLRHETIGRVEDDAGPSIESGEDVFNQTLVTASLFPDRVAKSCRSLGDGHALACTVPFGLCPGTEPRT